MPLLDRAVVPGAKVSSAHFRDYVDPLFGTKREPPDLDCAGPGHSLV